MLRDVGSEVGGRWGWWGGAKQNTCSGGLGHPSKPPPSPPCSLERPAPLSAIVCQRLIAAGTMTKVINPARRRQFTSHCLVAGAGVAVFSAAPPGDSLACRRTAGCH